MHGTKEIVYFWVLIDARHLWRFRPNGSAVDETECRVFWNTKQINGVLMVRWFVSLGTLKSIKASEFAHSVYMYAVCEWQKRYAIHPHNFTQTQKGRRILLSLNHEMSIFLLLLLLLPQPPLLLLLSFFKIFARVCITYWRACVSVWVLRCLCCAVGWPYRPSPIYIYHTKSLMRQISVEIKVFNKQVDGSLMCHACDGDEVNEDRIRTQYGSSPWYISLSSTLYQYTRLPCYYIYL